VSTPKHAKLVFSFIREQRFYTEDEKYANERHMIVQEIDLDLNNIRLLQSELYIIDAGYHIGDILKSYLFVIRCLKHGRPSHRCIMSLNLEGRKAILFEFPCEPNHTDSFMQSYDQFIVGGFCGV